MRRDGGGERRIGTPDVPAGGRDVADLRSALAERLESALFQATNIPSMAVRPPSAVSFVWVSVTNSFSCGFTFGLSKILSVSFPIPISDSVYASRIASK